MNPEHNFRHAHDLPPMTPAKFVCGPRIDPNAYTSYGWIAIILAAGILCVALIFIARASASPQSKDQRVIGKPDVGAMVRPESKHCKYKLQGSTLAPRLVCSKGRG